MDTCELYWTVVEQRLFSLLCRKAGTKLSQREIAKALQVSPTAIANALKSLGAFASIEKAKTVNFVSLNRENPQAIELKRVENLKCVYLSGLADCLEQELAGGAIILFGSYSHGEDVRESDIDIAVIGRKAKPLALEPFERLLERRIHVSFYADWKSINANLKNNILGGILLHGSVEL